MKYTNKHNLPDAIVAAVQNDSYDAKHSDITATGLIDAPQRRSLIWKHKDKIQEDVSDRIWALLGQAVHHILERSESTARVEERLFAEVEGWTISGQFDRLLVGDQTLQDYKVTTVHKAQGDGADWERQLNILRWLCHHNGIEVEKLQVVAILRDWSKSRATDDGTYPITNVVTITLPVWPLEVTGNYIRERVQMHQLARAGENVPCTDEERWKKPDKYVVTKPGAARARKVCDSMEAAQAEVKDHEVIEVRKGAYLRCESYCEAAPFCRQWQMTR